MLEQVLDYIHNYFEIEINNGYFTISDGKLVVDFLQDGQYFKIKGSVFNDGVYKYDSELQLVDETFNGEVWALAIPPAIINIAEEVSKWQEDFGSQTSSPYQSESFGGYSYTKASTTGANGKPTAVTWQSVFGSRLNAYRRIS